MPEKKDKKDVFITMFGILVIVLVALLLAPRQEDPKPPHQMPIPDVANELNK